MSALIIRGVLVLSVLIGLPAPVYAQQDPVKQVTKYPNGEIFEEFTVVNGVKSGPAVTYYASGALRSEDNYVNGQLDGVIKRYLENGKYFSINTFKNGVMEGLNTFYYPSGIIQGRQMYKNNVQDGLSELFYEDGTRKSTTEFINGVFNGKSVNYHKNGRIEKELEFKNGVLNGRARTYTSFGVLITNQNYENGKNVGLNEWYSDDGVLKTVASYKNGLLDGIMQSFDENGVLKKSRTYKDDKLNGMAKYYYHSAPADENADGEQEPHYRSDEGIAVKWIVSNVNGAYEGPVKFFGKDGTLLTEFVYSKDRITEHTPFEFSDEVLEAQDLDANEKAEFLSDSAGLLFVYEDFDRIEQMAVQYRKDKTRFSDNGNKVYWLYAGIGNGFGNITSENEVPTLDILKRWEEKYPQSVAQKIMKINAYMDIAWKYRGTGFASSISEEGVKKFKKYISDAYFIGKDAAELAEKDPELYATLITVSMAADAPESVLRKYLDAGREIHPTYMNLYRNMLVSLLPKWGGAPGEAEDFIEWAAEATSEELGSKAYAILYDTLNDQVGLGELKNYKYSWDKLQKSFDELLLSGKYDSVGYAKSYSNFIRAEGDAAAASKLMAFINNHKEDPNSKVWGEQAEMDRWEKWAKYVVATRKKSTLLNSVTSNDSMKVKKVISENEDINKQDSGGVTPLMIAIMYHKIDTAILLINQGAKVDIVDGNKRNALHFAAQESSDELLKLIIEKGAPANQSDQWGFTPLHYASRNGYSDHVSQLMAIKNVNVNGQTKEGAGALHLAADAGHIDVTNELLKSSLIDINLQNDKGQTALHLTAGKGFKDLSQIFLAHSADKTIEDSQGKVAADYAQENGFNDLFELLK